MDYTKLPLGAQRPDVDFFSNFNTIPPIFQEIRTYIHTSNRFIDENVKDPVMITKKKGIQWSEKGEWGLESSSYKQKKNTIKNNIDPWCVYPINNNSQNLKNIYKYGLKWSDFDEHMKVVNASRPKMLTKQEQKEQEDLAKIKRKKLQTFLKEEEKKIVESEKMKEFDPQKTAYEPLQRNNFRSKIRKQFQNVAAQTSLSQPPKKTKVTMIYDADVRALLPKVDKNGTIITIKFKEEPKIEKSKRKKNKRSKRKKSRKRKSKKKK